MRKIFSLKYNYDISVTDQPTAITSITIQNKTKKVSNYANVCLDRLHYTEFKIGEITKLQSLWKNLQPKS